MRDSTPASASGPGEGPVSTDRSAFLRAARPVHVCFSFKVGDTPHKAAMRSMELMMGEVKPKVEKALGVR